MRAAVLCLAFIFSSSSALGCMIGDYDSCYKEAKAGDAKAQTGLGFMYFKGRGVDKDPKEAFKWYQLAADQGNAFAQSEIGIMYMNGDTVERDYKEAAKWFRLAADQGYAGAQRLLATMYARGHGVDQSDEEAQRWNTLADSQGDTRLHFIVSLFGFFLAFLLSYPLSRLLGSRLYTGALFITIGGLLTYVNSNYMYLTALSAGVIANEMAARARVKVQQNLNKPPSSSDADSLT